MEDKTMIEEIIYFDFRIIEMPGGEQIIDDTIKTPMDALTPEMQMEYKEVDEQLAFMDWMRRKERREKEEERREAERKQKLEKNPLWKLACFCGIV